MKDGITRAQLAEHVGTPPRVVEHWERAGLLIPSVRQASSGVANLFGPRDVAIARFLAGGRRNGLSRAAMADAAARLNSATELTPGWSGWLAMSEDGRVRVTTDVRLLTEVVAAGDAQTLIAPIVVPTRAGAVLDGAGAA